MKHTYSINKYQKDEVAKFRMKVITFYDTYGLDATKEAFAVARSTVFVWKKNLKESLGSNDYSDDDDDWGESGGNGFPRIGRPSSWRNILPG